MTDLPEQNRETYLGDGLFASFDGWHVTLRAPRGSGDHWITLEPAVWRLRCGKELIHSQRARQTEGT